jgi:cell division protein ZapA
MGTTYKVSIYNKEYTLSGEEGKDYTTKLAKTLDGKIREMKTKHPVLSVTDCAVLTALDCLDELVKANQNIENIRSQIKDYVDDAGRARNQANSSQREINTLKEKVAALEKELSERTNYAVSDDDTEPVSAEDILSQDIREAIAKPVEPAKPKHTNYVGTVNYDPTLNGGNP